ncbi:MAG TPA: alanine racemase C-terminal domain-containing protein, partial [Gemmatimonadales bacterium]|nr:alanine racemase C-terminal domain-containing protein [Gemmatimonadales bacterium]
LEAVRDTLARAPGWEGVFTHFVSAESDPKMTALQWTRFQEIVSSLPRRPSLVHAANSAAALAGQTYAGDLVRPGIFLYGGEAGARPPRPVAALRGQVVALRSIQTSDPVGYNATWRAQRPTLIATISVGYADGLPRSGAQPISDQPRQLELGGRLVPIVGRVTMDMCMVAVDEHVAVGETATVYGGLISIDQQAAMAGTVSYELLTRLGSRVSRCYQGLE